MRYTYQLSMCVHMYVYANYTNNVYMCNNFMTLADIHKCNSHKNEIFCDKRLG